MATTKSQVLDAVAERNDDPASLICFYRAVDDYGDGVGETIRCTVKELPEREFDDGYGGVNGEQVIAFSPSYVYIKGCYDGSEWVQAVPRDPVSVSFIPVVGGG